MNVMGVSALRFIEDGMYPNRRLKTEAEVDCRKTTRWHLPARRCTRVSDAWRLNPDFIGSMTGGDLDLLGNCWASKKG